MKTMVNKTFGKEEKVNELSEEMLEQVTGGEANPVHSDIGTISDENALPSEITGGKRTN